MKILLQTGDDLLFLAGDGRVSERLFSSVAGFELAGELETQIVRKVRGSHARAMNRGNIQHRAFFRTRRLFPTPAEAEDFVANAERSFPRTGTVYFVTAAGTRKLLQAVITPPACSVQGCEARLQYSVGGGEFTPAEPELVIDGVAGLMCRMVTDAGEKWFEVGFDSPTLLDGSAADGWMDPDGHLLLRLHRSENLTAWDNDWIACPTSPETITGGYRYWGRSKYPQDSAVKSGQLRIKSIASGVALAHEFLGNASNSPFQSITLVGAAQTLPNFPYTMPTHAAQLQTDLRAAGWTGATVDATSATVWDVIIPSVSMTSFGQENRIGWTQYAAGTDPVGGTIYSDRVYFYASMVNAAGVRTGVAKQFARLGVSAGPNYLYGA